MPHLEPNHGGDTMILTEVAGKAYLVYPDGCNTEVRHGVKIDLSRGVVERVGEGAPQET